MILNNVCLVGDIRHSNPENEEYLETLMRELQDFMIRHRVEKIDVGWSRNDIMNEVLDVIKNSTTVDSADAGLRKQPPGDTL